MAQSSNGKSLLVVVASDPRSSHRPAEAIRLAAGLAAWRNVVVTLFFTGPASAAVGADCDDFVDEESYTRYLPMFVESGGNVYVQSSAVALSAELAHEKISRQQFAALASKVTYLLRF